MLVQLASGGLRRGDRDRGAEFTTVAARLLFGLLAQLAGEIGEPVQCRIDADQGEIAPILEASSFIGMFLMIL